MSQPGLDIFLEVELLKRIKLTGASCHDMAVSGDGIGHVEVLHVLGEGRAVQLGLSIWLVSELFETGALDEIELDQVRSKFGDSGSEFIKGVIRERTAQLFGKSSQDHPVILREAW